MGPNKLLIFIPDIDKWSKWDRNIHQEIKMIHTASDQNDNVKKMLIMGVGLTFVGWFWNFIMPINKQLWTSSYVLVTAGIAFLILAILIWIIDIKGNKKPFKAFEKFLVQTHSSYLLRLDFGSTLCFGLK